MKPILVAKNEKFIHLANEIAALALEYDDVNKLLEADFRGMSA